MTNYLTIFANKYVVHYKGLPRACWQGIALACLNTLTIGFCFFLSLYFVTILHFTPSMAGFLLSFYALGTVLGGVIAGKLTDAFLPRRILIFCLLLQSITFFLLSNLQSFAACACNLFFLGFAAYGFKTSNNVWMFGACGTNTNLRYQTISISHVAANFGLGLSGVLITAVAAYSFQSIFYLSTGLLLCSALYVLFSEDMGSVLTTLDKEQPVCKEKATAAFLMPLVLLSIFLVGLIIAQLSSTYPLYIKTSFPHFGVQAVSILFMLDTLLIVFFQAPLTSLVSKYSKLLVMGFGALFMGLGMFILTYSAVFALAVFSCIVWTIGEMLFVSTAQLLCYEFSSRQNKGKSLGLFQTVFAASSLLGLSLGGMVYQNWGGNLLWYCGMLIGTICFGACWYYSRTYADTTS